MRRNSILDHHYINLNHDYEKYEKSPATVSSKYLLYLCCWNLSLRLMPDQLYTQQKKKRTT